MLRECLSFTQVLASCTWCLASRNVLPCLQNNVQHFIEWQTSNIIFLTVYYCCKTDCHASDASTYWLLSIFFPSHIVDFCSRLNITSFLSNHTSVPKFTPRNS